MGFQGFKGTPAFRNASPVRAGGGNGSLGWPRFDRSDLFRSDRRRVSDNGCTRNG